MDLRFPSPHFISLLTGVKMKLEAPTHSPIFHHSSLATITCFESHRSKQTMLCFWFLLLFVSCKMSLESQMSLFLFHANTLLVQKILPQGPLEILGNYHKTLWTFSTFSKQLSHLLALTGKLSLDIVLLQLSPVSVNVSPTLLLDLCGRCPPHSMLLLLLYFLIFLCKSWQLWISCHLLLSPFLSYSPINL